MTAEFADADNAGSIDDEAVARLLEAGAARAREKFMDILDHIVAGDLDKAEELRRSMPVGDIVGEAAGTGAELSTELNSVRREAAFAELLDKTRPEQE